VFDTYEGEEAAASTWWIFLVTGIAWLLFSIIVFRFDWTTVNAIAILFGVVVVVAGINELVALFMVRGGWWKALHAVLGVVFVVIGIIAFTSPGNTFRALAAVFSFYLLLKGSFDIVVAFASKGVSDLWWIELVAGILQIALAFWAAGDFNDKAILLVVWVGAGAMIRGVAQLVLAFQLRGMKRELAAA
jgi:uncharacterized membrane protein HdeD (DUF308 family)